MITYCLFMFIYYDLDNEVFGPAFRQYHYYYVPPYICYHAEFGRSSLNGVGINTREPPKLGIAGTPTPLSWDGRLG